MSTPARKAFLVSHTHWDREWYQPFQQYRVQLTRVVRELLDVLENDTDNDVDNNADNHASFAHFVLDGQAVILEDYLAIHPADAERIGRLVREGKLSLGPWYVLPDEFLVSGEATVRNILLGHKIAGRHGPVQKVGYLPDSFGHIAQMPQILRLAGIDSFIYTRGNGDEIDTLGWEYRWRAPDGSEVLAVNQGGGYCNAGGLGHEELWHAHTNREVNPARAVAQVGELLAALGERANGDIYLLNNGCDHLSPQRELGKILAALREAFPGIEFLHASFADYLAAVREAGFATKSYSGELLGGKLHPILSGVWSAHIPLKQQNDACQSLLADCLEPAAAYCHFVHGQLYPARSIEDAWKLLLRNHPHDSICGCSIDEVHSEMEVRFAGMRQSAEQLLRNHLTALAPTFARRASGDRDTLLCVLNPLPEPRTEVIERLVVLQPPGYDLDRLGLFDATGRPVPFEILDCKFVERFWGVDYRTELWGARQLLLFSTYHEAFRDRMDKGVTAEDTADCFLAIQFLAADLPPLGHATFHLTDRGPAAAAAVAPAAIQAEMPAVASAGVTVTADSLENTYYKVRLHADGTIDVTDKETGRTYAELNRLESSGDIGDEYDYCPCPPSETVTTATVTTAGVKGRVRILEDSHLRGRLETEAVWPLPEALASDRRRRSEKKIDCRFHTRVNLTHGSRIITLETEFENRARDHRLRAVFPTGIVTDTLVSDGHFYLNRRPFRQPAGKDWVQPPAGSYPQQEYSLVQDGQCGLALLNRGLPEIQAETDDAGGAVLYLTLLRGVGWLSRDDFPTRNFTNAGPTLPTPAAQCLGRHTFRYALVPFAGDHLAAGIAGTSRQYRVPLLAVQGVEDQSLPGGDSLVRKSSPHTCISAIKKHDTRESLIVRLHNLSDAPVTEILTFGLPLQAAWRTDLLEERTEPLPPDNEAQLSVRLRPHEIVTLEVEFLRRV